MTPPFDHLESEESLTRTTAWTRACPSVELMNDADREGNKAAATQMPLCRSWSNSNGGLHTRFLLLCKYCLVLQRWRNFAANAKRHQDEQRRSVMRGSPLLKARTAGPRHAKSIIVTSMQF